MKKYIGTKQIEAEPMTKGEAWNQKLIREKPLLDEDLEDGYKVRYEDGYESWSPKDIFEKAYKVADTFKDRLIIEQKELADKVLKLSLFVDGDKFPEIVPELNQRVLLLSQRERMSEYLNILNKRIETLKD